MLRRSLKILVYVVASFVVLSVALVLPMRWYAPNMTMFMFVDDSDEFRYEWVDWDDIGTNLALAVVAAEDQRFADHFGVDTTAIQKALDEQDERGSLRGASTITQQTVKNLYLWSGRSFVRKGLEAWFAVVAEVCLPKRRILEIYLNIAELGPGIYGVGAASRHYFGKEPASLGDSEAALLAAVLPSPRRYRVINPTPFVRERRDWILSQMRRLEREGWITRIDR
ncbi:MAG: monofunctional biosynthetic peptidoglycan transglycosylase [Pseudomonadota bacterium]